ncbi:uncharacterized protein LOC125046654 [Penaeus chinensis]|uniref:uncharacterized protein LOC125046654 n=1 Tax=Penaeus chinensis TaxID=139456 RepID=UPI001FB8569E|nr:uncharacterized protein LOC125046654 [Penaeus chinensis]
MVNQGEKKPVPADDYYHAEEKLYTTIVESTNTAMSLIIDKYICLANGLPAPDSDIQECFGSRNKKKQSLVKYLEDHEPNEMTPSQTRKHSHKPQPARPPKGCTVKDIHREVKETLQRRKSQLGLPDDYEVREVQYPEVELESDSNLSEVEDEEDINDVVSSNQVKGWRRRGNGSERNKEILKGETQTQSRTVRRNRFCSSLNEELLFKKAYKNDEESRENVLNEPAINEKTQRHVLGGTTSSKTHCTQMTNGEKVKEKSTSKPEIIRTNGPLASVLPEELDHGALLVTDMLDTVFIPPFTSQEREKTLMKIEQKLGKHVVVFHFSCLGGKDIDAQGDDIRLTTTCPTMKDGDLETQSKTSRHHESTSQTEKDTHNEKVKTGDKKKERTVPAAKATECHIVCDPKTSDAHSDGRTHRRTVQNTSTEKSSGEEKVDNLPQERRKSRRISAISSQLTEKCQKTPEQHEPPSEQGETTRPSVDAIGKNTQPSSEDHKKRRRGRPKSKSYVVTSSTVPETDIKRRKRSISDQVPRQLRISLENIFPSEEEKLEEKTRNKEQELVMVPSVPESLQPLKEDMQAVNEVSSKIRNDKNFSSKNVDAYQYSASSDKENNPIFVNSENIPNLTSTSIDNKTEPHLDSKRQKPKIRRVLLSNGRIVFKYKMDSEKEICSQDLPPEGVKNISENTINETQRTGSILGNIPGNLWQKKMWHSKQEESIIAGIDPVKKKRKSLSMGHKPIGHKASDSMLLKWSSMIARNSTVELSSIVEDSTFSVIHPMGKRIDRARKQEAWGPSAMPEYATQGAMRGMLRNPPQKFAKPQAFPHDSKKVNRRNAEESLREAEQSKLLQLYNVKKPVTSLTDQMEQSSSSDEETTLLAVERSSRVVGPFHSSLTTVIKLREQFRDTSDTTVQVNRTTTVSAADSNLQNESAVRRTTKSFWELDDSDDSLPSQTFKAPSCPKPQGPKRDHKQITSMDQSSHAYSILGNVKWHKKKDEKKLDSKKPRLLLASSSLRMSKDQVK